MFGLNIFVYKKIIQGHEMYLSINLSLHSFKVIDSDLNRISPLIKISFKMFH